MLSEIEAPDRPVSCANTICLPQNAAIHCGFSIGHSGLEPDFRRSQRQAPVDGTT